MSHPATKPPPEAADDEIQRLMKDLGCVRDGEAAACKLVSYGARAVGPLKEFLFQGRPSGIYEPRRRVVAALASLGAKDVLIEYLRWQKQIPDAIARFGEEAVENAAARALAEWRTEEVFQALVDVSRKRLLPGVIEALGVFRRLEAVPYLDRALEDDMSRLAAEEAFRNLGKTARPSLVLSAMTSMPRGDAESPSSLRRRRSAVGLLGEIGVSSQDKPVLRTLLRDADPEIVAGAARLLAPHATGEDRSLIAERLIEVLPSADWFLYEDIENCLVMSACSTNAKSKIERKMSQRMALPEKERALDPALRVLLRVVRRVENVQERFRVHG
jgi:hypothetical protein